MPSYHTNHTNHGEPGGGAGTGRAPEAPEAPDPNASGNPQGLPDDPPGTPGRETREREAAWRRAKDRQRERADGREAAPHPHADLVPPSLGHRAFEALADNVRDYAIFLMDPDGVIVFWGEGARLMKWWTRDEAEGAHLRLLYPDGGSEDGTAEDHLRQAAESGEYTGEGRRVRNDCSIFWAGVTLTALKNAEGTLLGFAKVTRDLTARRAADAVLQAAHEEAERARQAAEAANRAKSEFLATMSHEIRTPLNAILGYHELLEAEVAGPLTPLQLSYLGRARSSGRQLLSLIDDVLDLARMEAGRLAVGRVAARIGTVLAGALESVEPQARKKGITVVDAVSGHAAGVAYWGDEDRVRQVIVNLLANAVKFTEPGGRITVSAGTAEQPSPDARLEGQGPWVYVRVEDTGIGIAPARLQEVFEPFVQGDMSHTRRHPGTGLGLAISRRLAREMGGDLTARSEPGIGSRFFLWLPAAPAESLSTGGVEGQRSPGGEAEGAQVGTLREVGEAFTDELERVLHGYVARLRTDPATPSARKVREEELEDHLATFLADVSQTLAMIDVPAGDPTEAILDSAAVQRAVAERHGVQRARLGWTADELAREYAILREEIEAAVRRRPPRGGVLEADRTFILLDQVLASAERVALESFARARRGASSNGER